MQVYLVHYYHTVKSQLEGQLRRSLLSFLSKGGYNIVRVNQYFKIHPLQEVGRLAFMAQQRARCPSPYLSLSINIVVHSVYILYVYIFF